MAYSHMILVAYVTHNSEGSYAGTRTDKTENTHTQKTCVLPFTVTKSDQNNNCETRGLVFESG